MTTPRPSPEPPETPQASAADLLLIERLPTVLAAALPEETPAEVHAEVHAEALHQLCLADGLLELLDWTHQGVGADPLACFWLSALRWHRLVTGGFPEAAPRPPSRSVDERLAARLRARGPASRPADDGRDDGAAPLTVHPGSERVGVEGLASGEMAYPAAPAQPEREEPAVLLRVVPLALVPYIDAALREQWVRQAIALTHGHPRVIDRAQRLVRLLHRAACAPAAELVEQSETLLAELEALLAGEEGESPVDPAAAQTLRAQLQAMFDAARSTTDDGAHGPEHEAPAALAELLAEWRRVTLPAG